MVSGETETRLQEITTENNIKFWLDNNLPYKSYNRVLKSQIWELLGICQMTWYNYLNCKTPVPHTILAKLVIILEPWGCTYDDLINTNNS